MDMTPYCLSSFWGLTESRRGDTIVSPGLLPLGFHVFLRQQRQQKYEPFINLAGSANMTAYPSSVLLKPLEALQVMKPQPFGIGMIQILSRMSPVRYPYRL